MTWRARSWIALLTVFALAACERKKAETTTTPPLPVVAVKAVSRDVPDYRYYPGTTQSPAVVEVDARIRGYLEERSFEEGDDVEQNDSLYLVQPDQYEAKVRQGEAAVLIAKSNLDFAQKEYDRNKPLSESGAISQQEWDRHARALEDATGRLTMAEANLTEARLNLSYCTLVAPISGRIGQTVVDVGNLVGPNSPSGATLATIMQLDPMRVLFSPPVKEFSLYERARRAGSVPVQVTVEQADGEPLVYEGVLDLIDNTAQSRTSTFVARALFSSPERLVLPDQFAVVRAQLGTFADAVLVPTAALVDEHTSHYVRVVKPDDTVERRTVQLRAEYGALTRISSGLSAGETVVVEASPVLRAGGKVSPTIKGIDAFEQ